MTSKIKILFFLFLLLANFIVCFSQNTQNKKVTLIEKQNGKRLELFAKNTDTISYVVFLRVTTTDFRRSAKRPILKPIAPNSETHLLTLIKLAGSEGMYTPHFIVNETSTNIKYRKDDDGIQRNFDKALSTTSIIIYEAENCNFCQETKDFFTANKINFEAMSVLDNKLYLIKKLKKQGLAVEHLNNTAFILEIESNLYSNINNKEALIDVLRKHID